MVQHGENQVEIDIGDFFGEQSVEKPGAQSVGGQFKGHGQALGKDGRHGKEEKTQQRRHKSHRQPIGPAADKAAEQNGNVHGREHFADLGNLAG